MPNVKGTPEKPIARISSNKANEKAIGMTTEDTHATTTPVKDESGKKQPAKRGRKKKIESDTTTQRPEVKPVELESVMNPPEGEAKAEEKPAAVEPEVVKAPAQRGRKKASAIEEIYVKKYETAPATIPPVMASSETNAGIHTTEDNATENSIDLGTHENLSEDDKISAATVPVTKKGPKKRGRKKASKVEEIYVKKHETDSIISPAKESLKTSAPVDAPVAVGNVTVQFSGKSYSTEDLVKIAKDVWVYDLGKDVADFKSVELYVKTEENTVYYVINDEVQGSFNI